MERKILFKVIATLVVAVVLGFGFAAIVNSQMTGKIVGYFVDNLIP